MRKEKKSLSGKLYRSETSYPYIVTMCNIKTKACVIGNPSNCLLDTRSLVAMSV